MDRPTSLPWHSAAVIGNSGFVGRRLQERLDSLGVNVRGFSRSTGYDVIRDELPLAGVEHVFHVAGQVFVPNAWSDPASFYQVNAYGTVRVLEQCRRAGVPVTYVSAYVYGAPASLPIAESAPARANNPYAFSKLAGEEACRFFMTYYGLQVSILRLFNVYGPGQQESFLIPTIARQVLDPAVREIVVADLGPRRDFVHIDDVVDALLSVSGGGAAGTFNVGSGESWSVEDVIATCLRESGTSKAFRDRGERRSNEIMDVVADITAIKAACGWMPRVSFTNGIRSVLESVRS